MLAQLDFSKITLPTTGTGLVNVNDPNLKIGSIIGATLTYIFAAAGIALLIYLVLGGLQLMTSRGDPKAAQAAQGKITNAVIGFVIVVFAFFIVQIFGQVFGLQGTLFGQIFK